MTPAEHIERAAADFAAGRPRYWVKLPAGEKLDNLHKYLYKAARAKGYKWHFEKYGNSVMISQGEK